MNAHTLEGRSAIITGASQGLGRAIAEAFVRAGAHVLLAARDGALLDRVRHELAALAPPGRQVHAQRADVSRLEDVAALRARAEQVLPDVTIVVNNAGVYGPIGPFEEVPWDQWKQAIEINLFGTVLMCREVVPVMRRQGYGKIINLSGGGATAPLPRFSSYAASKVAVVRLTETLAEELRDCNIDVNAIAPGALNTRLLDEVLQSGPEKAGAEFHARAMRQRQEGGAPLHRAASLAVFLASAASDGISGRLLSALWDRWEGLPEKRDELARSDVFTLRRIVTADRGLAW